MFGTNPVRGTTFNEETLWVQSVFATIQGEGPFAGTPAIFVRLAGCNLRCWFCDTDFESGTDRLLPADLLDRVVEVATNAGSCARLVVITGGEPMRQQIAFFCEMLIRNGFWVQIETAGTCFSAQLALLFRRLYQDRRRSLLSLVCSPKTSTVHHLIDEFCRDYKYIVRAGEELSESGIPLSSTQTKDRRNAKPLFMPMDRSAQIWLQPCDEQDPAKNKANQDRCVQLVQLFNYRLSLQQHKIIGVE